MSSPMDASSSAPPPAKKITAKDLNRAAWDTYKQFREQIKAIRAAHKDNRPSEGAEKIFFECIDVLNAHDPVQYKLYPRGKRELLRFCAKRLDVDTIMRSGLVTKNREAWAGVVARLKSKYSSYKTHKRLSFANPYAYRRLKPKRWIKGGAKTAGKYYTQRTRKPGSAFSWGTGHTRYYKKRSRNWGK